jgi:hypothetical protein
VTTSFQEFWQLLAGRTPEELIACFNREVRSPAWVSARANYLTALRDALLATGLDCSSFIADGGMSMSLARRVRREGDRVVIDESDSGIS